MRSFEQYDEVCKYFAEGRLANETQAQLQLYSLSVGEHLVNKYALWLDFRTIDENELHGMGRQIRNTSGGGGGGGESTYRSRKKRNQLGSQGLHLPNHGFSVEHPKWRKRFCSILD